MIRLLTACVNLHYLDGAASLYCPIRQCRKGDSGGSASYLFTTYGSGDARSHKVPAGAPRLRV